MRHTPRVLATTVAAVALAACGTPTTAPTRAAVGAPRAQVLTNEKISRPLFTFSDCNGDFVSGTGTEHFVYAATADGAGGLHVNVKDQYANIKLTGTPSGASYVSNETISENLNFTAGGAQTATFNETFKLIGQGQTPNEIVHVLLHVTIDANGTVTSAVDHFSVQCH